MSDSPAIELTQRQADIVGRQFNSVLTNTIAYSPGHAVTQRAAETFIETLNKTLPGRESLTLLLDRGSLFVEEFALDSRFNPTRIVKIFRELELHSVTFLEGVDLFAIETLMAVLADHEDYFDVSSAQTELMNRGVSTIQLNHVVMRKVTRDDEIIQREGLEKLTELAERQVRSGGPAAAAPADKQAPPFTSGKAAAAANDSASLHERIEEIFSMQALVQRPQELANQMIARAWTGEEDPGRIAEKMRSLRSEIGAGSDAAADAPSLSSVMDAVERVRAEISETLSSQQEIAHFMAESGGEMLDEVEQLTCDTVLAIVREEYRGGAVSVRRLAQIMRRVLPEGRDLKRFLPQLKQGLMAEGMPLDDYIALVRELGEELKSDQLAELLEQGSEAVGVSFDELLREIRHDPDEAARLLVLAAELRGLGGRDPERLSNILAEYVERVSGELIDAPASSAADKRELKQLLRDRRRQLVQQIGASGVPDTVARGVEKRLDENLDQAVDLLRVRSLVDRLADGTGTLEITELAEALADALDDDTDLKRLGTRLQGELIQRGYDADQLRRAFEQTERRLRNRSRLELLPDGMLEPNVLNYLLEREIAACRRFGTYFSCVLLMIARVAEAGESLYDAEHDWRTTEAGEIEELLPQLFRTLPPHVRDIDLLGSLGTRERNIPLVVLTMAHEDGARIVLDRMLSAIAEHRFELAGRDVWVDAVGVAERFDFERTPDRKSWLNHLQSRLARELMKKLRRSAY